MSIDLMRDKPTVGVPIGQGTNGSGAQMQPVNPAYNTYVGARYVPIFAGDWDATKSYEPLTIVMWQGNSYTSKTFVPAQTEIGNEDFWALTGNYNAQVEMYRNKVEEIANKLTLFSSQKYKNSYKNIVVLADSWGTGFNETTGWTSIMKLNDIPHKIVNRDGAGFSTTPSWTDLLKQITSSDYITDIYVCGGTNDRNNTLTNIINGCRTFRDYAKANFKNATIHIMLLSLGNGNSIYYYSELCKNFKWDFINLQPVTMFCGDRFWSSSSHPTSYTQELIASCAETAIKTGKFEFELILQIAEIIPEDGMQTSDLKLGVRSAGGVKQVTISGITVRTNNMNTSTRTLIGSYQNPFIFPTIGSNSQTVAGFITDENNQSHPCIIDFDFIMRNVNENVQLWFSIYPLDNYSGTIKKITGPRVRMTMSNSLM